MDNDNELKIIKNLKEKFNQDKTQINPDDLYLKYLGKKGEIRKLLNAKNQIESQEKKIEFLKGANILKKEISSQIEEIQKNYNGDSRESLIDLSVPVKSTKIGNLHPTTATAHSMIDFFRYYGFSHVESNHIENDYNNFEMLGVTKDHPARELQDTIYINEPDILLRTQTSSTEAVYLDTFDPPIRCVSYGPAFRNETNSKTNASFFHQFQGFYVDKNVNMGHLKWILSKSIEHILGKDTVYRFRSKYYPEVIPSLSPDIQCKFCKGKGCSICKHRGWTEIAGGGMISPKTLEMAGIDSKIYSGFAFGFGLDRIAMNKYKIEDIRILYNSSIVYKT